MTLASTAQMALPLGASRDDFCEWDAILADAFEDDRRNVAMFHAEGIPCVYIHSGYYD